MRSALIALTLPMVLAFGVALAAAQDAGQIKISKGCGPDRAVRSEAPRQRRPGRAAGRRRDHGRRRLGRHHVPRQQPGLRSVRTACSRSIASSSTRRRTRAPSTSSLKQGTLAVVSGKLAKQSPEAMKVQDAGGDPRRARDRVPRSHRPGERLIPCPTAGATSRLARALALTALVGCASRNDLYVLLPGQGRKDRRALVVEASDKKQTLDHALRRGAREERRAASAAPRARRPR